MSRAELKQKGFTIIEVVLVLAIAALIFLMVFIAFPALQRNQKDTQRRTDVGRFMSQLSQYQTNTKGSIPTQVTLANFVSTYLQANGDTFNDPDTGNPYTVTYGTTAPSSTGTIVYADKAICNDTGDGFTTGQGARKAAVITKLQSSGYFCQGN